MLREIFRIHAVIVIAIELDHVFEESPLRSRDAIGEHFRSIEDHRERLNIRDRRPDLIRHRVQDRRLVSLSYLTRLQLAKATLRVRADDFVYERWDRLGIGCGRSWWLFLFCLCLCTCTCIVSVYVCR